MEIDPTKAAIQADMQRAKGGRRDQHFGVERTISAGMGEGVGCLDVLGCLHCLECLSEFNPFQARTCAYTA